MVQPMLRLHLFLIFVCQWVLCEVLTSPPLVPGKTKGWSLAIFPGREGRVKENFALEHWFLGKVGPSAWKPSFFS